MSSQEFRIAALLNFTCIPHLILLQLPHRFYWCFPIASICNLLPQRNFPCKRTLPKGMFGAFPFDTRVKKKKQPGLERWCQNMAKSRKLMINKLMNQEAATAVYHWSIMSCQETRIWERELEKYSNVRWIILTGECNCLNFMKSIREIRINFLPLIR